MRKALLWPMSAMLSQATALFWELHWEPVHEGVTCSWAISASKRWCASGIATHLSFLQPSAVDSRERTQENKHHRASICTKYNLYRVSVGITLADASWLTSESIWKGARMRTTWDAEDRGTNGTVPHCLPLPDDWISFAPTIYFSSRSSIKAQDHRREVSQVKRKRTPSPASVQNLPSF